MRVVGTMDHDGDEVFLGIWDDAPQFWEWFEMDYSSLRFISSGQDNDSSFIGSFNTYATKWRKYKDALGTDYIVQVYIIR